MKMRVFVHVFLLALAYWPSVCSNRSVSKSDIAGQTS